MADRWGTWRETEKDQRRRTRWSEVRGDVRVGDFCNTHARFPSNLQQPWKMGKMVYLDDVIRLDWNSLRAETPCTAEKVLKKGIPFIKILYIQPVLSPLLKCTDRTSPPPRLRKKFRQPATGVSS